MHRHLGIYAGTFDPIHEGHLAFAQAAVVEARLDQVFLLPEPVPRGKQRVTPVKDRLELLQKATADVPKCMPLALPFDQYTVQHTLPFLEQHLPEARLSLLVGSDTLQTMQHWPKVADLLGRVQLIVGVRAPDTTATVTARLEHLEQLTDTPVRYLIVQTSSVQAAASSSRIRAGAATGIPAVDARITEQRLYS